MKNEFQIDSEGYQRILEGLNDGLYFVDRDRKITFWNQAAERITGFKSSEVLGKSCADNILTHVDASGTSLCLGSCPIAATIKDSQPREAEVYLHHKEGHRLPVLVRTSPLMDSSGKVTGGIELFTDISSQRANQLRVQELEKMALLDDLTQLANRRYLERELEASYGEFLRYQVPFGFLFMDIDHFKAVNDTYGHDIGDRVLTSVANTLVANSRPFDLYGRWGGEEFAGIIRNILPEDLKQLGERVRILVQNSYLELPDGPLQVTISAGATVVREGDRIEDLVKRADELLYQSKNQGRNRLSLG